MPQLLIHRGTSFCREYYFSNADCLLIGRTRANDIHLPDASHRVSRCHAAIVRLALGSESYFIRDLGSLRGVRIAGKAVFQHVLREGDTIEIADFELIYSAREPATQEHSPLRVVSKLLNDDTLNQDTMSLTGHEIKRELNYSEAQKEVIDSLLQATRQRAAGRDMLVKMLPAITRVTAARKGFAGIFRPQIEGTFDVLCRSGMSPGDQIEITDANFAEILLRGQPLLEGHTILAPIFDRDAVMGFFGLERPGTSPSFTQSDVTFVLMAGRMAASRDHVGTARRGRNIFGYAALEWPAEIVGRSRLVQELRQQIDDAALSDTNVLIQGESGVGKELVARAIHSAGRNASGPFIARNCAAITESLAEAEIFGHVARSGIAGADVEGAPGWFEQAAHGALFLDEIQGLGLTIQDKFLRVLQEKEVWRVRGRRAIPVTAQVIAATDHSLERSVHEGTFRAPLYFRFGKQIKVPTLVERKEDIHLLTFYFLDRYAQRMESPVRTVSHKAMQLIQQYPWPGNIRELESCIKSAVAKVRDREILFSWDMPEVLAPSVAHLQQQNIEGDAEIPVVGPGPARERSMARPMAEVEKEKIMETLESTRGNITTATRLLGYRSRQTMLNKMDRYEIPRNYGDPDRV